MRNGPKTACSLAARPPAPCADAAARTAGTTSLLGWELAGYRVESGSVAAAWASYTEPRTFDSRAPGGAQGARPRARRETAQQFLLRYPKGWRSRRRGRSSPSARISAPGAAVADLLGVSRSRITRWLKGEGIDPLNAERVDLLELVWSNLGRIYDGDAAREWLLGLNPSLGDRRPIDLIRAGRAEELMRAIRAERGDSFA